MAKSTRRRIPPQIAAILSVDVSKIMLPIDPSIVETLMITEQIAKVIVSDPVYTLATTLATQSGEMLDALGFSIIEENEDGESSRPKTAQLHARPSATTARIDSASATGASTSATDAANRRDIFAHPLQERRTKVRQLYLAGTSIQDIADEIYPDTDLARKAKVKKDLEWLVHHGYLIRARQKPTAINELTRLR